MKETRRTKNKLMLFHRPDLESIIVVEPDGKLYKWIGGFESFAPCYAVYNRQAKMDEFGEWHCWAKYPTRAEAIKAMKAYGKNVKFVGCI